MDNLVEFILSYLYVGSVDRALVPRLEWQMPLPLKTLARPLLNIFFMLSYWSSSPYQPKTPKFFVRTMFQSVHTFSSYFLTVYWCPSILILYLVFHSRCFLFYLMHFIGETFYWAIFIWFMYFSCLKFPNFAFSSLSLLNFLHMYWISYFIQLFA